MKNIDITKVNIFDSVVFFLKTDKGIDLIHFAFCYAGHANHKLLFPAKTVVKIYWVLTIRKNKDNFVCFRPRAIFISCN